ncbi:MAG: hypothetical protein JXR83_16055 [Deltaproteobacteria bacterium]|nr:hypothetical protein [Deltaproteobacteria bacterium]
MEQTAAAAGERAPSPIRGTSFSLRNSLTALSLAPAADATYNPYSASTFGFTAAWWFDQTFYFNGALDVTHEWTMADSVNHQSELVLRDSVVSVGGHRIWTVPWVNVGLSADLALVLPTSKRAQAETLWLTATPSLSLGREFEHLFGVIKVLSLSYTFKPSKSFHSYTTSSYQGPTIQDCRGSATGCEAFLHNGLRNVSWSIGNSVGAELTLLDWLSLDAGFAVYVGFLYPLATSPDVSYAVSDPVDERYVDFYQIGVNFKPTRAVTLSVGTSTANQPRKPDGTLREPVFNRYTQLFIDLRLSTAGLLDQLARADQ